MRRALIVGYFSTVGDLEVLDVVRGWLSRDGYRVDVAPYAPDIRAVIPGAVDAKTVDPARYSHLVVACGPYSKDYFRRIGLDLDRFSNCIRVGVNLSMVEGLSSGSAFDVLWERDSEGTSRPDLAFLAITTEQPVIGLCLAPEQREYGSRQEHRRSECMIAEAMDLVGVAVVSLDTHVIRGHPLPVQQPAQFESALKRLDALVTTRLHGLVLGLKSGVPVLAIDPIRSGGKVLAQAKALDWPEVVIGDSVSSDELALGIRRVLDPGARAKAREVADRVWANSDETERDFLRALQTPANGRTFGTKPLPLATKVARRLQRVYQR